MMEHLLGNLFRPLFYFFSKLLCCLPSLPFIYTVQMCRLRCQQLSITVSLKLNMRELIDGHLLQSFVWIKKKKQNVYVCLSTLHALI